jgi:hypothetical protein
MFSTDYAHPMQLAPEWSEKADHFHLGIHVNPRGVIIGIFDFQNNQPLWLVQHPILPQDLPQALQNWGWTQPLFRKVTIGYSADSWTLVPAPFFQPDQLQLWLADAPMQKVSFSKLPNEEAVLVYRNASWTEQLIQLFPQSQTTVAPQYWLQLTSPEENNTCLFAYIESDKLCIHYMVNHERKMLNQFDCRSAEDALYFISACLQHHNGEENTPIVLMGQDAQNAMLELLSQYYTDVKVWTPPLGLQMPSDIAHPEEYYSILMHTLCA